MLIKILCAVLLLPFCSFKVLEDYSDPEAADPYFSHPRDRHSSTGSRIIGGGEVTPYSYPFQVSLIMMKLPSTYFCGGTLISNQWVLTAAHCVEMYPDYILVGLGVHNLTDLQSAAVVLNSTVYIGHKSWNSATFQNDVALIRLPYNVTFTSYIQPVDLASGSDQYAGDRATIIGWGQTETEVLSAVLKYVNVTVMSNADCANTNTAYNAVIRDTHICTSGTGNVGICSGDSGGPLIVDGVQVGITSFGTTDCQLSMPSVFTRVSVFREWILQNAQDGTEDGGTDTTTEAGGSTEDDGTGGATARDALQMTVVVLVSLCFLYLFK